MGEEETATAAAEGATKKAKKRGRGRPPGSKSKGNGEKRAYKPRDPMAAVTKQLGRIATLNARTAKAKEKLQGMIDALG